MKISYSWLKNYIDIDLEPAEVSRMFTDSGLEVEDMQTVSTVKGGLKGIVIGEVKECRQHPNADKLSVTKVDIGSERLLDIVCGAPNVAEGQKVPVAIEGAILYSGDKEFKIKKTKLRGEPSEGMICAEDELGLGYSHEGIMVLDPAVKVGTQASEYFNVKEDTVYEIGLTPNRADATSHIGAARDLVAVMNCINFDKKNPNHFSKELIKPSVEEFAVDNYHRPFKVLIEDTEACPRYSGLTLTNVEVKESPDWLKNYLLSIDVRPINNIVDISNFVLFETGQPLHIFDAEKVKGDTVIIKKRPGGSKFFTLDEEERELTGNDLMICDEEEGMCIAGVFGGLHAGVTEKTKNIFIESAYFEPTTIRKTSQHHGLKTDASFRFERGADPDNTIFSLKRAAIMIKELAGGTVSSDIIDEYPNPITRSKVPIVFDRVDELIGQHIDQDLIKVILRSMDIEILEETDKGLILSIPNNKVDVKREADVIEEILRIYGYNNVEFKETIKSSVAYSEKPDKDKVRNIISHYLTGNGFYEIMTNSLSSHDNTIKIDGFDEDNDVRLLNPLSKELNVMRQSLIFGAMNSVVYNLNRQQSDLKFYEFGNVYSFNSSKVEAQERLAPFYEQEHLSLTITGRSKPESWNTGDEAVDFFQLKLYVHHVLKRLGINASVIDLEQKKDSFFTKALRYMHKEQELVVFGEVSDTTLKQFDCDKPVYFAEFNWNLLMKLMRENVIMYTEIPKYPEVRRDLALLLDKDIEFAQIEKIARTHGSKLLKKVSLFDVYEGKNIPEGKKSYAVSFILQDPEKTLTDKVIDKIINKLMKAYTKELKAEIRQ